MKQNTSRTSVLSIPNTLFHVCVFISLNEYYKYNNIFLVGREQGEEYKIYKRNVEQLMEEKMNGFSIVKRVTHSEWMNPEKLMSVFKYRLVVWLCVVYFNRV